ncbi:hypothetical protein GCM10023334_126110 [Nonomuraea thailandensis]
MTDIILIAYIGTGGTLASTLIAQGIQWLRNRADDRRAREQALAEVLAAAVTLSGVASACNAAWSQPHRLYITVVRLLRVFPAGRPSGGWQGRLADVARDDELDKRATLAALHGVLTPQLDRTTRVLISISMWRGRRPGPRRRRRSSCRSRRRAETPVPQGPCQLPPGVVAVS